MIRGEARLVFRDVNTGDITREFTESNYVTEDMLYRMATPGYDNSRNPGSTGNTSSTGIGRFGQYIFLGGVPQEHDRGWNQMWPPLVRGVTEAGITNPSYLTGNVGSGGTFAYYHQWQQRFAPPASDRTFYLIGINRNDDETIPNNQEPIYVSAYIVLTTPCTQTTTETLDVFYRVIFDNPNESTSDLVPSRNMMRRISERHRYSGNSYFYPDKSNFFYHSRKHIPNTRNEYMNDGGRGRGTRRNSSGEFGGLRGLPYVDSAYRTRVMRARGELELSLGCVVGSIGHTESNQGGFNEESCLFWNPTVPEGTSPIQNIFSHSATATGPFYSATSIPTGTGTLAINGDSWTNPDYHKLLRIEITGSGGVGTGTYKVWQRNLTGFINNTYAESAVSIPFINSYNNFYGIMFNHGGNDNGDGRIWEYTHRTQNNGVNMQAYDGTSKVVGWTHWMVIKYDMITSEKKEFRTDTTPALDDSQANGIDIGQVTVASNGDIWIADASNGLQRITADETTIDVYNNSHPSLTGIADSGCYGVTETPGRIWAIMHDSLIYTDDDGATFTVYNSGTTPAFNPVTAGEEKRYWFLQGDPTHADHRLAIGINTYPTYLGSSTDISRTLYLQMRWWDSVSGQGNITGRIHNGSANSNSSRPYDAQWQRRQEMCQFFKCSPNDGIWACRRTEASSGTDDDSPGFFNYNGTSPYLEFSPGDGDSIYDHHSWWTTDALGNDALLCVMEFSSQLRLALCQQDGQRLLTSNYNTTNNVDNNDPRVSEAADLYRVIRDYGNAKAYFKDAGLLLGSAGVANSGSRWYGMFSVGNVTGVSDSGAFKHLVWREYGWNGSAWVEGDPGSKTIHAADEPIIDGLTISFDDDSGSQTFVATDYYTVGVVDGIWMDGGTEFDSRYQLYYKPVDFNRTEIEGGGLLPATQSDAIRWLNETEISTMIDNFGTTYEAANNRFVSSSTSNSSWGFRMYGAMDKNAYFQFRAIDISSVGGVQVFGFANASKIGTAPAQNDIDYAVRVTHITNNNWRIEVLNNGTVVHTEYNPTTEGSNQGLFNGQNDSFSYFRFDRPDDGSNELQIRARNKIIYTFTGVSQSLIPTFWGGSWFSGYHYWSSMAATYTDYHVDLGDSGTLVGQFHPNFWSIDGTLTGIPSLEEIKINGVPVTVILVNDYGRTPLAAGEVELLTYQGKLRYSPSDAGKTLTIDRYNVILNEN